MTVEQRERRRTRLALAAFASFWLALIVVVAWGAHLEPVLGDGWGHYMAQHGHGLSLSRTLDYAWRTYTTDNPRIGQVFTFMEYADGPVSVVLTPAVVALLVLVVFALVTGRWPRPRRLRDTTFLAVLTALGWLAVPKVGQMLLYRPYATNYLYGSCFQLLLLVPYRFHLERPRAARHGVALAIAMGLWGVVAGLTNEHTGPAAILLTLCALWVFRRRGERRPRAWMLAGLVGLVAGYLLLFFAPGQNHRYADLAQKASLTQVIAGHGITGTKHLFSGLFSQALWLWVVVAALAYLGLLTCSDPAAPESSRSRANPSRRRLFEIAAWVVAALLMVATLLASPKQGSRLYLAPVLLLIVATGIAIDLIPWTRAVRRTLVGLAVVVNLYASWQLLSLYTGAHRDFEARLAALESAPRGSVVTLDYYTHFRPTDWFFGDDFLYSPDLRNKVGRRLFKLARVDVSEPNRTSSTLQFALSARYAPPLAPYRQPLVKRAGRPPRGDLAKARAFFHRASGRLARVGKHRLQQLQLDVVGLDLPELGGRPVIAAGWSRGHDQTWHSRIVTDARQARWIVLSRPAAPPPAAPLAAPDQPAEPSSQPPPTVFLAAVGDRTVTLTGQVDHGAIRYPYKPWRTANYLILACEPHLCHLTEVRHERR